MSDSAFRRLLLDTVETIIAQPPSSSSLIELLRIATPKLLAASSNSKQWQQADAKVRIASQREKLFKKLQLRIHPDKHAGDERATKLFQDVTSFYGSCVDVMGREDTRRRWSGGMNDIRGRDATTTNDHTNVSQRDEEEGYSGNGNERNDASSPKYSARWYREQQQKASSGKNDNETSDTTSSNTNPSQFAQWFPWWDRLQQHLQNPRRLPAGASSTHSDYENCDNEQQQQQHPHQYDPNPTRRKNNARRGKQPSSHQCCAVVSAILFPPFGLCALYHSFQVRRAWTEGRHGDAKDHSDQAYSYAWFAILVFACLCLYLWSKGLSDDDEDGDWDWDWDKIKRKFGWDDGP